jgi:amino-acid N-acetyltransferase
VIVERASLPEWRVVTTLLSSTGLPTDDLTDDLVSTFLVLRDNGIVRGAVGLECHGEIALLRSLVVQEEFRGHGRGAQLLNAAETLARELKVRSIYLLTTTADAFFARWGYKRVNRDDVPDEIRTTKQFSALCPSTAVIMVKRVLSS